MCITMNINLIFSTVHVCLFQLHTVWLWLDLSAILMQRQALPVSYRWYNNINDIIQILKIYERDLPYKIGLFVVVSFFSFSESYSFFLSQILLYNDLHPKNNLSVNSIQDHIFVAEKLQRLVSSFFHSGRFQMDNICNRQISEV